MPRLDKYPPDTEMPFTAHLVELRDRLLRIVVIVLVIFLILMPFANQLYQLLALPLLRALPAGASMIATEVTSPFLAPFKFAMVLAIFIGMPGILHQIWAFIAPGLRRSEQRLIFPLVISTAILFYLGVAFAYFVAPRRLPMKGSYPLQNPCSNPTLSCVSDVTTTCWLGVRLG